VPRIVLQKADEIFPAVRGKHCECFVLVCTDKNFILICQFSWPKKLNVLCHAPVCLHNPPGEFLALQCRHYNILVFKESDVGKSFSTHTRVRNAYKFLEGKPERSRPLGRLKYGCKDAIKLDLK
jgi:hypothetical protein